MIKFKDLGIKAESKAFTGDKIKMAKVLNKTITVKAFKIVTSKYEGKGDCLHLHIEFKGEEHVVFTGSTVLMDMIRKVPEDKFPFETEIVQENGRLEFR